MTQSLPTRAAAPAIPFNRVLKASGQTDPLLFALARSVEEKDPSLGRHCERLALLSSVMGLSLGLSAEDIATLNRGGFLHDIGKIVIPDAILLKPGPLDQREWEIMKTHPERGEAICRLTPSLRAVLPIIRHHHENWNGSGYPDGLKGAEIPLLARITQTADIFDALTSERPYKKKYSPREALAILKEEARQGLRDPNLISLLEAVVPLFGSESGWDLPAFSLSGMAAAIGRLDVTLTDAA